MEGVDLSSLHTFVQQPFPLAANNSATASSGTTDQVTTQVLPFPVPFQGHASIPVGSRFARAEGVGNYLSTATEMPLLFSSLWAPDIHTSSPPVVASIPPQGDIEDTDTDGTQDLECAPSHVNNE
jgi:hypothetical protein